MILGAGVVLLVAILAFNYFKSTNNNDVGIDIPPLTEPASTVNLPANHTVVEGDTLWSIRRKLLLFWI